MTSRDATTRLVTTRLARDPLRIAAIGAAAMALLLPPAWLATQAGHSDPAALTTGFWLLKGMLLVSALGAYMVATWLPVSVTARTDGAQDVPPGDRIGTLPLALLLCVGLALRLPALGAGLWFDEIQTQLEYVRLPWGQLLTTFDSTNQHLLFSAAARLTQQLGGESATTLRLPAVLFGVASLWAALVFGRRWMPARQAWWAAALLAVAYHHIWFSQNARGYTSLLLWTVVSSTAFLDLLRGTNRPRRAVVLYSVCMALALLTHLTGATVALAHGLAWLWRWRHLQAGRARWAPLAALVGAGLLTATCYAPIVPQVLQAVGKSGVSNVPVEWQNPLWFLAETVRGLARALPGGVVAVAVAGAVGALGVVVAWQRDRIATVLMILPLAIMAAMVLATGHNLWPRFFFFGAAFLVQLAVHGGFGILDLLARLRPSLGGALVRIGDGVLALAVLGSLAIAPKAWGPKQDFAAAVAYVEAHRAPGDAVVVTDLTRYPVQTWLGRDWPGATTGEELAAAEGASGSTWVLYTFPIRLSATFPTLWERLQREYRHEAVIPGTVGDGAIVIVRRTH